MYICIYVLNITLYITCVLTYTLTLYYMHVFIDMIHGHAEDGAPTAPNDARSRGFKVEP